MIPQTRDALLNSLNLHLKEKSIRTLIEADYITIFADEATSLAGKEMMGLFVSASGEKNKKVLVEFVSVAAISSTQSIIFLDKVRDILSDNNIGMCKISKKGNPDLLVHRNTLET